MNDAAAWALDHWSFCVFVIGMVIQFTPAIRLNPLGALGKIIGKHMTAELSGDIVQIKETLKVQADRIDENEKDRIRYEVLSFANSCRNGRKHTKEEFEHIVVLNGKYKCLLARTGDRNGVFEANYEYIYTLYQECLRTNDFLDREMAS